MFSLRKIFIIFIFWCFLVADTNYYQLPVTAVRVSGNRILSQRDILTSAKVTTRTGQRLDPAILRDDQQKIFALGGFNSVNHVLEKYQGGVKVTFVVKENPVLKGIRYINNEKLSQDKVAEYLQTTKNAQLNFRELKEDIDMINRIYKVNDYTLSSVQKVWVGEDDYLNILLNEPKIEKIEIVGNNFTQEHLLLREFSLQPGDVYNEQQMTESRNRLFALGYFSLVSLPEIFPGEEEGTVRVRIMVKEKEKNNLNFGFGFTSRERFGFARLNLLNLLNTGEQLTFRFQTGQEYRGEDLPRISYSFRYYTPWFFQRNMSFGYTRYLNLGYETLRSGSEIVDLLNIRRNGYSFDAGFPLPFGRAFRFIAEYKDETVEEAVAFPRVKYINKSIAGTYLYNGLSLVNGAPVDGEYFKLRLEKGGQMELFRAWSIGLGGVDFTRVDSQYSRFVSLSENNNIIGFNLRSGSFVSAREENVLEGEEYTVGGSNTVRGYPDVSPFAIGPKMTLLNLEYRYLFNETWQGVLFYDWGNAYTDVFVSLSEFKSGYGVGLRLNTPIGPIRFDLGRGEKYLVFHFGLGYTF